MQVILRFFKKAFKVEGKKTFYEFYIKLNKAVKPCYRNLTPAFSCAPVGIHWISHFFRRESLTILHPNSSLSSKLDIHWICCKVQKSVAHISSAVILMSSFMFNILNFVSDGNAIKQLYQHLWRRVWNSFSLFLPLYVIYILYICIIHTYI